jgi:hypothetical protein
VEIPPLNGIITLFDVLKIEGLKERIEAEAKTPRWEQKLAKRELPEVRSGSFVPIRNSQPVLL